MAKLNTAESSASTPALFKEDLPRKMVFQEVWMNKHEMPPAKGRQLEAADEGTLMGRLAARMAARDFIDELNLGPSGRTSEAKKAQVADNGIPGKLHLEGPAIKTGTKIEKEHKDTVNKIKKNPKISNEEAYKNIAIDHLKETPLYYNKKVGLPEMENRLTGAGLHVQTSDKKSFNMSDPLPDKGVRKGNNMMEQAKNAGNVFHTMSRAPGKR